MHDEGRNFGGFTSGKCAELTAALSQRRGEGTLNPARGSGGCLFTGKHLNTHTRQLVARFFKTSIPSVEPLFKVVGTNRGMADHLDHKLHAGWKHFKGEVSGMGHRTVGVPHQDKAWPLLSFCLLYTSPSPRD